MKKLLVLLVLLSGCASYQSTIDTVYYDEIKDGTTIFTNYDNITIRFDYRPLRLNFYRGSDLYWGNTYGYWGSRPLWLDFDFYYGGYSYINRPWNYWDYYMIPWRPNNNWYQGPYNNQGYNVVYNSSRRNSLVTNNIQDTNISNKTNRKLVIPKPIINKPTHNFNPIRNDKPIYNRPVYNNNKPVINNSKPSNNNRPVINNNSRSTRSNSKSSKNPR
tara:strand:+ start:1290 stop:1940 length:651 start_codon:yes stop_codon:yes gene_type:complete